MTVLILLLCGATAAFEGFLFVSAGHEEIEPVIQNAGRYASSPITWWRILIETKSGNGIVIESTKGQGHV